MRATTQIALTGSLWAFSSGELWRNRIHLVVIHLCSPLLCQTSWLQRQLLKDGIILLTIFVGIVSVQHQVLTISLSHGIVTRTELVYRMLVTLLYVSKQWGVYTTGKHNVTITLPIATSVTYAVIAVARTTNSIGCTGSQNCQYVSNVTSKTFQAGSYDAGNGYAGFWWLSISKA